MAEKTELITTTATSGTRSLQDRMLTPGDGALQALVDIGKKLAESNLGKVKNPADGFLIACFCHERGVGLVDFLQSHHIVQGRITRSAEYMLAEFYRLGGKIKWIQADAKAARAEFTWDGQTIEAEFTVDDAKRMVGEHRVMGIKSKDDIWYCHTAAMMRARLVSTTFRFLCPQISGGFYTEDELRDAGVVDATATNITSTTESRRAELEAMAASVSQPAQPANSATVSPSAKEVYEAAVGKGAVQDEVVDAVIEPIAGVSVPGSVDIPFAVDPPKASGEQLQRLAKLGATCGYTMAETCDWASRLAGCEMGQITAVQITPLLDRLTVLADIVVAAGKLSPPYDVAACKSMLCEALSVPDARDIAIEELRASLAQLTSYR